MTNLLVERGYLTQSLGNATHSGEHGFKTVPGLLNRVLEERAWEKRIIIQTGQEFEGFHSFADYIKTNPPKGLGSTVETLDSLIGKDEDLRARFYKALRQPHGGDRKSANAKIKSDIITLDRGTSKAYALQKLNDEKRTDLLEQVNKGELSPHAAMVKAGYRRRVYSINLDSPKAASALIKRASPALLQELRRLLIEEVAHS